MTIDTETLLLNAYHDGELSPGEALAMERRIEREPELAAWAQQLTVLSSGLVDVLPGPPAPDRLRGAVLATLSMDLADSGHAISDEDTDASASRPAGGPGTGSWRSILYRQMV